MGIKVPLSLGVFSYLLSYLPYLQPFFQKTLSFAGILIGIAGLVLIQKCKGSNLTYAIIASVLCIIGAAASFVTFGYFSARLAIGIHEVSSLLK
ncbi:hypothetical protein ACERII_16785 [Evansella sp. AB-rgal1]|uniref:hypothetical protein n=1 Tax=Evansella sp. AB-rgal1 TaxID=3242696 RepID=UPI00359D76E2